MPCQSYESNWAHSSSDSDVRRLKKEADKLARIACKALTELIKHGKYLRPSLGIGIDVDHCFLLLDGFELT